MSRCRTICLTVFAIVSCLFVTDFVATAAENSPESQNDLRFRRIEIPVDSVESFVGGLIPRPRVEFEELVREESVFPSTFMSATYDCELIGGDTIRGRCRMLRTPESDEHKTAYPAPQSHFEIGGRLSMQSPIWLSSGRQQPAIMGRHREKTIVVNSPQADAFAFNLSQRGLRNRDRVWFLLNVPSALSHELKLSLPAGTRLQANQAIVNKVAEDGADAFEWSVQWAGAEPLHFVLEPTKSDQQKEVSVRLDSVYQFRGNKLRLNGVASIDTSALRLRPKTLAVKADTTLSLINATVDGERAFWTAIPSRENSFVVELPDTTAHGNSIDLQLSFIADCPRGELFSLPRMRVEGRWVGEAIRWEVENPLEVSDVLMHDCRCRSIKNASDDVELIEFDAESEFSEIQLQVDHTRHELDAEALVQIELKANSVVADVEVRFEPLGRELFDVSVDISQGWAVVADSVDAVADSASFGLRDSVMDQYQAPSGNNRSLSVRLNQGAATNRPVFLRFRIRNDSLKQETSIKELVPLRFPGVVRPKVWIHGKDSPGLDLVTSGAEHVPWRRLDDSEQPIPEWLEKRIVESSAGSVLQSSNEFLAMDEPNSRLAKMSRQPKATLVRVQSRTNVVVGEEDTRYTLELLVDPLGNEMNKLNVTFSEPVDERSGRGR